MQRPTGLIGVALHGDLVDNPVGRALHAHPVAFDDDELNDTTEALERACDCHVDRAHPCGS